ncbi:hypothetical protein RNM28_02760 [Mesomycoplasma ovipneumoniae]|nr:hypothetical protein [Mesomycoplasma ovipneumoniae]WNM17064.1 hypothetical protein RNM28_02760 [Mesomycoplasma ovipneumoniae]
MPGWLAEAAPSKPSTFSPPWIWLGWGWAGRLSRTFSSSISYWQAFLNR